MFTATRMGFRKIRRAMVAWMIFWAALSVLFAFWTYNIQESLAHISDYYQLKMRRYTQD